MKYFLVLLLSSCASTTVYENGKKVFSTQADITGLAFSTTHSTLTATRLVHSVPTRAGGSVIGTATAGALPIVGALIK